MKKLKDTKVQRNTLNTYANPFDSDRRSLKNCELYCSLAERDYYERVEATCTGEVDMFSIAVDKDCGGNQLWKRALHDSPSLSQRHFDCEYDEEYESEMI